MFWKTIGQLGVVSTRRGHAITMQYTNDINLSFFSIKGMKFEGKKVLPNVR